jgi:hypothetical protein
MGEALMIEGYLPCARMRRHGVHPAVRTEFVEDLVRGEDAVEQFIARYRDRIIGVLSGFDRLVFRGTLRSISYVAGMMSLLWRLQVLLKDFGRWAEGMTERLKRAVLAEAERAHRPVVYLPSSGTDKEAVARKIAERDGVREGLIAVLSSVEPCWSFDVYRNRQTRRLELVRRPRKCLFLYRYSVHPVFGFLYARIQTWLPFPIQIGMNGREWLSRQMDRAGIAYDRHENCFPRIDDVRRAQQLMDRQLRVSWPTVLAGLARELNPAHDELFRTSPTAYYWSVYQSEWATDVMFKNAASLAAIYPALVHHAITGFSSRDVLRFLGRRVRTDFAGEVVSDFRGRPEGVRIKHRVDDNSLKLYDKAGSILRPEVTMNDPSDFKVFRCKEGNPHGPRTWRPLRRGVADLHRRTQICQAINERYLAALSAVPTSTPIADLLGTVCRPAQWHQHRVRALRPWAPQDLQLLQLVGRGEFLIRGLRNRDLRQLLFPGAHPSTLQRRHAAQATRLLRLLRAHGLLKKIPTTHRYLVTPKGRALIDALLRLQRLTFEQLDKVAA